jgi:hypothetical protein
MAKKKKDPDLESSELDSQAPNSILEASLLSDLTKGSNGEDSLDDAGLPREKRLKGPLLNLALLTFFFAVVVSVFSIFAPFKAVEKVETDGKSLLSVQVTISNSQFSNEPALTACNGSGRLTNLNKAIVVLESKNDGWIVKAQLGSGQINSFGDCVYTPQIDTPENFDGGVIKPRVEFTFGTTVKLAEVTANDIQLEIKLNS